MKLLRSALLAAFVVLALCAGTAGAKGTAKQHGPRLDPSFGRGGGFTVAATAPEGTSFDTPMRLSVASDNEAYVQRGTLVVAFGPDGRPDRGFGRHGRQIIASRVGAVSEVAGIAVDSVGRLLVAGTVEPVPGLRLDPIRGSLPPVNFGGLPVQEVFVERYLPNGRLDPSFGTSGEVDTTLASPNPMGTLESPAEYERPSVRAVNLAVDAENRPVLAAKYVERVETCLYKGLLDQAIVARLNEDGMLDPSFGGGGAVQVEGQTPIALAPTPGDGWATLGGPEICEHGLNGTPTHLSVLTETGAPAAAPDPLRPRISAGEEVLAVDGQDRALYTEQLESQSPPRILRLLANGDLDTSFGQGGQVSLKRLGAQAVAALTIDSKGRIVAGFGSKRFKITRISSKGKIEGSFGDHGVLSSRFEVPTYLEALAIDSKGRIVVAGAVEKEVFKLGTGIAIARFLPR